MTVHETAEYIESIPANDPDRLLKIMGACKRLVHEEKAGLLIRMKHYCEFGKYRKAKGRRARNKVTLSGLRFMKEFIDSKFETHEKMCQLPDEEVITWSVGRHVYKDGRLQLKG
jgi:hypothetical protein